MLSIRFLRTGRKKQPFFRLVVCDKRNPPKGGRFLELLGFYDPLTKKTNLNAERIKYWLSVGAKCSDTVHNLLVSKKIIEAEKIPVHKKKKKGKTEPARGPGDTQAHKEKSEEQAGTKAEIKEGEAEEKVNTGEKPVEKQEEPKEEKKAEAKEAETEIKEKPEKKEVKEGSEK